MFADAAQVNVLRDNGRWTLTAPRRTLSRPAVWGDRVYVLVDGHAAALDRADGSVLWRSPHRVGGELESRQMEFTATGGHLVVPSDRLTGTAEKAGLSVLDAGSGALCWQSDAGPLAAYHTDRRTLVTVHRTGIRPCRITALDLATGTRLWQREVRSLGTAVLAAGRLITFGEDEQAMEPSPSTSGPAPSAGVTRTSPPCLRCPRPAEHPTLRSCWPGTGSKATCAGCPSRPAVRRERSRSPARSTEPR